MANPKPKAATKTGVTKTPGKATIVRPRAYGAAKSAPRGSKANTSLRNAVKAQIAKKQDANRKGGKTYTRSKSQNPLEKVGSAIGGAVQGIRNITGGGGQIKPAMTTYGKVDTIVNKR